MVCGHCRKTKKVMFVIEAAPKVKDDKLRAQLDAEGRGNIAGDLNLCIKCYRDGMATPVAA